MIESFIESFNEYQDTVLESFNYPDMVVTYAPEDVAKTINATAMKFFVLGVSHRYCAVIIWALTMEKVRNMSKNEPCCV